MKEKSSTVKRPSRKFGCYRTATRVDHRRSLLFATAMYFEAYVERRIPFNTGVGEK
jgi:hypothetical protein